MQKKLIALAIAGLSSAAFAQSNVTIYGVMDATYDNVSAGGPTAGTPATTLGSRGRTTFNSSYIGFKGVESIGNGLAVAFQVETGLSEQASTGSFGAIGSAVTGSTSTLGSGAAGWANRDTYVGLAGGFGTIAFGNLTGPTRALGAKMDVNSGATGVGANTALLGKMGGGSGAGVFDQRIANAIAYISPNFNGFSGVLGYLPNENKGNDAANVNGGAAQANTSAWTLGLNYEAGPVYVGFAYTKVKDNGADINGSGLVYSNNSITPLAGAATAGGAGLSGTTDTRLAAKYDFGMGTVGLLWNRMKADTTGFYAAPVLAAGAFGAGTVTNGAFTADAGSIQQTVWYLPVTFNVGSGKVLFQYGKANSISGGGAIASPLLSAADTSAKHVVLGYEYNMSKRTTLKAVYSRISNSAQASNDFLYGASAPNSTSYGKGVSVGADPSAVSFGLRHSF